MAHRAPTTVAATPTIAESAATPATAARRPRRVRTPARWAHVPLVAVCVVLLFPFYWSIVIATNTSQDIYQVPPKLLPGTHVVDNLHEVFATIDVWASMGNTLVVAVATTALVLFLDTLAAFAFAKFDFPGRRALFALVLLFFMLPAQLSLVPQYLTMIQLGLVGTLRALVIPAAVNAFGIFWMRQYIAGALPDELLDAARLDGCGFFRQYLYVVLPVIRPGLAFLGIYTFVAAWNDYVWPLIVLVDPSHLTLQVALSQLNVAHRTDYAVVMAGALVAVAPLLVVFLIFSRQFVADATKGAVRG